MTAYGTTPPTCACCGHDRLAHLSLDHVHGDGHKDRDRAFKGGLDYRSLFHAGFPDKDRYQVLCHNCNMEKGTKDRCPCQDEPVAVHKNDFSEKGEMTSESEIENPPSEPNIPEIPMTDEEIFLDTDRELMDHLRPNDGPVVAEKPKRTRRPKLDERARASQKGYKMALTLAERERKKQETARKREELKAQRAAERVQAKIDATREKITLAEGGEVQLPAAVLRDGTVVHVSDCDAWAIIELSLDDMCLDVETSGYPVGHKLYELRTIQLGGEHAAVVFDAADAYQRDIASLALNTAKKLRAHSATADVIPCVIAGLIQWDAAWAKMQDSVLNAKLTDPKMSGSDADALKELARDLLREYAVSPNAEKAKNELFKVMGCLSKPTLMTPPDKNGWYSVNKNSVVMTRYAGSDVLDLAAVLRVMPPIPVDDAVMEREREFQTACAPVSYMGFPLDAAHVKVKIAEAEAAKAEAQEYAAVLSQGRVVNPKSSDVLKILPELFPGLELPVDRKTKRPTAGKEALESLCRDYPEDQNPQAYHLFKQIARYRREDTKLGLLLRPFEVLCDYGDGRGRTTIYTIEATTGRTSSRRFNAQQLSRQGGVRACITTDPGYLGISADFQGCELRVAAALSGDKGLYEAEISPWCYKCEQDTFDYAPCACGLKPDDTVAGHIGLHWRTAHSGFGKDATYEHRYMAKRATFTRLFGGGPETAAAQVGCAIADMQSVFRAFDKNAPEFTEWDNRMRDWYRKGSLIWKDYSTGITHAEKIDGQNRMIYRAYSGRNIYVNNGQHAAGNGAIQGTARELLVDGVLRWNRSKFGGGVILPVHDEVVAMVKAEDAEAALIELVKCMETRVLSSPGFEVLIGADVDRPWKSWQDSS